MRHIFSILSLLFAGLFFVQSDTKAQLAPAQSALFYRANAGRVVSGVVVHYNTTPYSYITSKAGFSDTGSFQTGSNVIGVATMSTPAPNTGLGYDDVTDSFINGSTWFRRGAYDTAANAAAGTIPTYWRTVTGGSQGVAMDPINRYLYRYQGTTSINITDLSANVIESINPTPSPSEASMLFYDHTSEILYMTGEQAVQLGEIYGIKKVAGTWTVVFNPWYQAQEGGSVDYVFNKFVCNGINPGVIREQDLETGLNIVQHPYPLGTMVAEEEGFIIDGKDGTFWLNSDQETHGSITNGNRAWHTDPRGLYQQFYRTPDMDTWTSVWKLNGNAASGRLNGQYIRGTSYSIGPVVDYASFTGQQTAGNWTLPRAGENAHFQWRGSSSAPTTTAQDNTQTRYYHGLRIYDANGTNEGWGSTTPGAWQDTPTTDRYMQVRVKPLQYIAPADVFTPMSLGSNLHYWFSSSKITSNGLSNEYHSIYNTWFESEAIDDWYDVKNNTGMGFEVGDPFRPVYNTGSLFLDFNSSPIQYLALDATETASFISTVGTDVEINVVMRKPSASARAVILSSTVTSTNNNQIRLQHLGSGNTPANYLCIEYTDNSGTVTRHGITDTSNGTFRMITFRFHVDQGGANYDNEIYVNKVKQTLTDNSGTNDGQSFNLLSGIVNTVRLNRVEQNTSDVTGNTDIRDIVISQHLTTQQRSDLYDYFVAQGQL